MLLPVQWKWRPLLLLLRWFVYFSTPVSAKNSTLKERMYAKCLGKHPCRRNYWLFNFLFFLKFFSWGLRHFPVLFSNGPLALKKGVNLSPHSSSSFSLKLGFQNGLKALIYCVKLTFFLVVSCANSGSHRSGKVTFNCIELHSNYIREAYFTSTERIGIKIVLYRVFFYAA